jgi:hypothetical protein
MDVKSAIRLLWKDKCSIVEYEEVLEDNKSTSHVEKPVLTDEICKLSFEILNPTNQTQTVNSIVQTAKLFIDERLDIKAGSKIIVEQTATGKTFEFAQSGEPGVFENHQEISMVPFERWA